MESTNQEQENKQNNTSRRTILKAGGLAALAFVLGGGAAKAGLNQIDKDVSEKRAAEKRERAIIEYNRLNSLEAHINYESSKPDSVRRRYVEWSSAGNEAGKEYLEQMALTPPGVGEHLYLLLTDEFVSSEDNKSKVRIIASDLASLQRHQSSPYSQPGTVSASAPVQASDDIDTGIEGKTESIDLDPAEASRLMLAPAKQLDVTTYIRGLAHTAGLDLQTG